MDTTKLLVDLTIGDGWIGKPSGDRGFHKPVMRIEHAIKQLDYARHKEDLLVQYGLRVRSKRYTSITKKNFGKEYYRIDVLADNRLIEPHTLLYVNKKKTLKYIIDMIDAHTLAYWFMDDGWGQQTKYALKRYAKVYYDPPYIGNFAFACHSFSVTDNELVQAHLKSKFNIDTTLQSNGKILSINTVESKNIFHQLVSPYIIPAMRYKIDLPLNAANTTIVKRESR
jgi:hypothetical protein